MKLISRLLFIILLSILGVGFYIKEFVNYSDGEKVIGLGVLWGAFIFLPVFLYHRWKGKDISNYMFTSKNIKKMAEEKKESTENQ